MRISSFLLFFCSIFMFAENSHSQNARVTINQRNVRLATVLDEIEKQTDYLFLYEGNQINMAEKVSVNVKNMPVNQLLSKLFSNSQVHYAMEGTHIVLLAEKNEILHGMVSQQQITVTGTVTDINGEPLPGVSVMIKGTTRGTSTGANGVYDLPVPDDNAILEFSYIGFISQEVVVGNRRTINITLMEDTYRIEEVVVVGYGVQRVATLAGSVSQIKSEKITAAPIANVTNMLAGQLPGLISKQTSGIPGYDDATLRIRGFGSPLVIVDGIETNFNNLDANQIETISILKDGAASIYGARAGNGVILVTTKRGSQSKPKVNVNSSLTLQGSTKVQKPASSAERAQKAVDEWLNQGRDPSMVPYSEFEIEMFKIGTDPDYLNTDWFDAAIRRYAPQQNHNLSVSGGNEMIRYYGYFGYNSQETIMKKNGGFYDRYNFQVNIDTRVTNELSIGMDMKHFKEQRYFPSACDGVRTNLNFWDQMIYTADPTYPLTLPDESRMAYAGIPYGSPLWGTNTELSGYQDLRDNVTQFAGEMKYDFPYIQGLNAKGVVIYRNNEYQQKIAKDQEDFYTYNAEIDQYTRIRSSQDPRSLSMSTSNTTTLMQQYSLNYTNTFLDAHSVTGMFLYEYQLIRSRSFGSSRSGYTSMILDEFFAGNSTTASNSSSSNNRGRLSWIGRLNYSFKDRYMVETILRADASSRYAKDYRWGYFPSISLGWNVVQEDFMKGLTSFDQLKLRASYGSSGYDDVANFAYLSGYSYNATYSIDGTLVSTLYPTSLANPLLTWEEMSITNAGLDFSMWHRRLYGELDFFVRNRSGIPGYRTRSIPSSFGASLPQENLNCQRTSGFELRLGTAGKIGDLRYDVAGNISFARSKWTDFDEPVYEDPDEERLYKVKGTYTDRRLGYIFDGLFTSQEEVNQWPLSFVTLNNDNSSLRPGDVKYKDLNGDGVIDWRDQTEIGRGASPNSFFGLNINLGYKNFDLSTLFQGAFHYTTSISPMGFTKYNYTTYWHETRNNKADAFIPRPGGSSTNGFGSDYRNINSSYMRLKYLSLGYEIPVSVLSKVKIEKFRIYVAGTNLFTVSNLNKYGVDPEMPEGYGVGIYYPQQFTMSMGCNVTF